MENVHGKQCHYDVYTNLSHSVNVKKQWTERVYDLKSAVLYLCLARTKSTALSYSSPTNAFFKQTKPYVLYSLCNLYLCCTLQQVETAL